MPVIKRRIDRLAACALLALAIIACNKVPDDVIQPEEMAALMADVRIAGAVVSVNASDYRGPAAKEALKQEVFRVHGVTEAQYDSSLVWYGHNIGVYQEVTDRCIEILEQRAREAGSAAASAVMSVAGDSVDVWDAPRLFSFSNNSPTKYITFALDADRNWEPGDVYTWHIRFLLAPETAHWQLVAEYDDGAVESQSGTLHISQQGRQEIMLFCDSTREARSISGWLEVTPAGNRPVVVDGVGLIRRRRYIPTSGYRLQRRIVPRPDYVDSTAVR